MFHTFHPKHEIFLQRVVLCHPILHIPTGGHCCWGGDSGVTRDGDTRGWVPMVSPPWGEFLGVTPKHIWKILPRSDRVSPEGICEVTPGALAPGLMVKHGDIGVLTLWPFFSASASLMEFPVSLIRSSTRKIFNHNKLVYIRKTRKKHLPYLIRIVRFPAPWGKNEPLPPPPLSLPIWAVKPCLKCVFPASSSNCQIRKSSLSMLRIFIGEGQNKITVPDNVLWTT